MITRSYLRPIGRIAKPPARDDLGPDDAIWIGKGGQIAFAALELIERNSDLTLDCRVIGALDAWSEIADGCARATDLQAALDGFATPRAEIAGLAPYRPRLMGVVNVTPDSFSDGGNLADARQAIAFAKRLADEGADFLDIGGESTRPGSDPVPVEEELRRVMPVIEGLVGRVSARISIDTRKSEVMRKAAAAGAQLLNDVSALELDPESLAAAAETGLPVVLMHSRGDPKIMQQDPRYDNVLLDVFDALSARVEACLVAGIPKHRIIVDPGIGFGKTPGHNLELLAGLSILHGLGVPIMLGASRKSTIGRLTGTTEPSERVPGSIAAALSGAMQGASILRVHDVAATRQALTVWEAALHGRASATCG
jgi:dihydropteroate synthase